MIPEDFKNDTSQTTEQPSFDQNTNIHSQVIKNTSFFLFDFSFD